MSDKKPPVIVMLDGPAAGAMAALSLAAASMKTTQVLVATDSAEQTAPTPRTDAPHVSAAFINAIAEEGSKREAIEWLQKTWNENCQLRRELSSARAKVERLREALEKVERWQFPPTGKFWESGTPVSYGAAYGSNGERDYMRNVARAALAATRKEEGNG